MTEETQHAHMHSHPYMTTGKIVALTRWTFVNKVMSLLFNMLSSFVIAFLPKSSIFLNYMVAFSYTSVKNQLKKR